MRPGMGAAGHVLDEGADGFTIGSGVDTRYEKVPELKCQLIQPSRYVAAEHARCHRPKHS